MNISQENHQETLCTIALTQIPNLSLANAKMLYQTLGTATQLFENRHCIRDIIPDATDRLQNAMKNADEALKRAEAEMQYIELHHIQPLCYNDPDYPQRMKECDDAPLILYYLGNADLNSSRIINMVGTRRCTEYGKDICNHFIADLKRYYPDTIIVSGLAYGIDVNAHRAALANDMETIGVLAHGLDRIYPALHRSTAATMTTHGGLITEYISGTTPEKMNFVRRNRIIAGISDATIVVESAKKGGSLITADIAESYHRDVFAFPGRLYD